MRAWVLAFVLCLFLLSATARAASFTDSTQTDFDQGTYDKTTTDGETIIVSKVNATFYSAGTYTSRQFNAGSIVSWKNITWKAHLDSLGNVTLRTRFGSVVNGTLVWGNWSSPYSSVNAGEGGILSSKTLNINAQYAQYRANLTVANVSQAESPHIDDITFNYGPIKPNVTINSHKALLELHRHMAGGSERHCERHKRFGPVPEDKPHQQHIQVDMHGF